MNKPTIFLSPDAGDGGGGAPTTPSAPTAPGIPGDPPSLLGNSPSPGTPSPSNGTPSPSNGEWIHPDGTFSQDWTTKLPDELGDAREGLGKYRSVADLAKAHHYLEQKLGLGVRGVIVPNEKSTPEEIANYRKAIGVPEKPEEYQVKPDTIPEGVEWNDELAKPFIEVAHKHNIPPAALKELVALYAGQKQAEINHVFTTIEQRKKEAYGTLQKLWGADVDQRLRKVGHAVLSVGGNNESYGFGDPEVIKTIALLSARTNEDAFIPGQPTPGIDPAAAADDIQTNPKNPYYDKYRQGDAETVAMVRGLRKRAAGVG